MRCINCGTELNTGGCPKCTAQTAYTIPAVPVTTDKPLPNDRIMKHFNYLHLPPRLQEMAKPFHDLAHHIHVSLVPGAEKSVCLRKLLEGREAAIRAKAHPGG